MAIATAGFSSLAYVHVNGKSLANANPEQLFNSPSTHSIKIWLVVVSVQ